MAQPFLSAQGGKHGFQTFCKYLGFLAPVYNAVDSMDTEDFWQGFSGFSFITSWTPAWDNDFQGLFRYKPKNPLIMGKLDKVQLVPQTLSILVAAWR